MFTPTRAAALEALQRFLPQVSSYSERRNFALPDHSGVSRLSPYIRRRLISEREVVRAVLERYPFERAEKFIQEVVWRTYWKGWLELHPTVWNRCLEQEARYGSECAGRPWGELYQQACRGDTNLTFFNEWVRELTGTGYLHNHVRMWFASVWIFTFKIPWQLGAMFMYRHLLDGDPASNTLSWRWVAGLQTKGKSYLARADNISKYSEGRWNPQQGELAEDACKMESDADVLISATLPKFSELPLGHYGVLTTSDDLSVEQDKKLVERAKTIALLSEHDVIKISPVVASFAEGAEVDALKRFGAKAVSVRSSEEIITWTGAHALRQVVIVMPPVGPNQARAFKTAQFLEMCGVAVSWYRSSWDIELHALADKGFFPFWERVKKRLQAESGKGVS